MIIKRIETGFLKENCYILIKNNNALIIDPGDDYELIINEINNYNIVGILITHAHFDHVGALPELIKKYNVPIYYNNVNNEITYDNVINIKEKKYNINDFNFEVIYTKGHRNDLCTFYFYDEKIMFTGDFLFKETVGRTDLEYGNLNEMKESIKKIKKYDNDIVIYPGHGEKTTLGYEKENNEYFNME